MDQCLTPEQRSELSLVISRDDTGLPFDDQLSISLGQHGQPAGRLRLYNALGTRCSTFRFDRSWLSSADRFLVSPDLREVGASQWCRQPISGGAHVFAALHDTAPSGFGQLLLHRACSMGLLSLLGAADGQDSQTLALCAVPDHARLGALRVSALNQTPADPAHTKFLLPFACDIERMGAMVHAFLDCRETPRQLLLLLCGFSALGGAQPKCSFVSEDRPLSVAKFFGPEHPSWMPRAEVLFSTLALAAGLRTVQPRLRHPVDSPIVITSRFDRDQAGRRTPYLSARSMLLIRPTDRVSWMDLLVQMSLYLLAPAEN